MSRELDDTTPADRTPAPEGQRLDPGSAAQVQRMGQVAREIGHDLNNCLGVVTGRAELLALHLERGNLEGAQKGVEVILKQMDRMKELSDALRELRHRS